MAYDFKKEQEELYLPAQKPSVVRVPPMKFLTIEGAGDPNIEDGAYKRAVEKLYTMAYTIRMSHKAHIEIEGFFEFVVPPLEGLWWQEDICGVDLSRKDLFQWISLIRVPDFVTSTDVEFAKERAALKKRCSFEELNFITIDEGLCVQMMHVGPYDSEPTTIETMDCFATAQGYALDFSSDRHHHEIYISDPRRAAPERLKTVIRHPIREIYD